MTRETKSKTERAVDFIRKNGRARSNEIEKALGFDNVAALLSTRVLNGTLVACRVERPGQRDVNEYRLAVSGGGTVPKLAPLRQPSKVTPPRRPDFERKPPAEDRQTPPARPPDGERLQRLGQIEKGIPFPPTRRAGNEIREHLRKLSVGDSFFTTFAGGTIAAHARHLKIAVTRRREGEGIRIWRAK